MNSKDTFTFTARSANNLQNVITLTLIDNSLKINVTGLFDQTKEIASSSKLTLQDTQIQTKPFVMKILESFYQPGIHVRDVNASANEGGFQIFVWYRVGGLRLAPIGIKIEEVDNPAGAEAFCEEINKRKMNAKPNNLLPGPLDYWMSWVGLILLSMLAFIIKKKKK